MMFGRLLKLIERQKRAKKLGVKFNRCASFKLPDHLTIGGNNKIVKLPIEIGVNVAFIDILLDDCYGLETLSHPIRKVLDIGANVGLFGLAARNRFPEAVIHAYEPNIQLENYLEMQARAADFTYFMEAVGLEDGRVTLDLHEDSVLTRSKVDEAGSVTQVAFRKAIERLGGLVDLAKVDCEGAEWLLFQDSDAWQLVRNLSMEYHLWPTHTHDEVREVVQNLGFEIKKQVPISDYGLLLASRSQG